MPQGVRRFLIASVVLLVTGTVSVQEPETELRCDTGAQDRSTETRLVASSVTPPSTPQLKTNPSWKFGPFNRRLYGFDYVTFFIDEVGPFEDGLGGEYGPIDVVVRVEGTETALLRVRPQRVSDAQRGALYGARGLAAAQDGSYTPHTIRLATNNGALPLFVVELGKGDWRGDVTDTFLLDLRRNRKRVPLRFTCVGDRISGACGAFDVSYQFAQENIHCPWSDTDREFHCEVEERVETTWGSRVATRYLPLSGQRDPGVAVERESATQVEQLARRFVSKQEGPPVDTGKWGLVHAIVAVPAEAGGSLVLLGTAGLSTRFGARFLVVKLDRNSRATLHPAADAPIQPAYWQDLREVTEVIVSGRPGRSELSFGAQRLESSSDVTTLLRVRVREGAANAVYMIGLDERAGSLVAGAMRLATDTSEYAQCGRAVTPPNVFEVRRAPSAPFRAELQIEPPRTVNFDGDGPVTDSDRLVEVDAPECPTTMGVTWDRGFRLEEPGTQPVCLAPSTPRFVEIREDGTIVAVERLQSKAQ
jgi:hypothetical protein